MSELEDVSDHSRISIIVLVAIGCLLSAYAVWCLIQGSILLPSRFHGLINLEGNAAIFIAISLLSLAAFVFSFVIPWRNRKTHDRLAMTCLILVVVFSLLGTFYPEIMALID